MMKWWTAVKDAGWDQVAISLGSRILGALIVLLVGLRVAKWIANAAERGLSRSSIEPTAVLFLRKVAYVVMLVVLILAALQALGVPMTSMFAVLGAAGLAIGLALKDSLSNIASGVMLVSLRPFRVGDWVTIAGQSGTVETVSIFQTRLRGADNQTVSLPNSLVTGDAIINMTPDTKRRIELVIGISYDDDIDVARAAALEVVQADTRVLRDPAPSVLVYELGESSVNLGVRSYATNADYFVTKCELTERIKKAFDRAGISIPFPQRDVHMFHQAAAAEAKAPAIPAGSIKALGNDGAR